jgi:hypothetical protein
MAQLIFVSFTWLVSILFLFLTSRKQQIISNKEDEFVLSLFKGHKITALLGLFSVPTFSLFELLTQKRIGIFGWLILWIVLTIISCWFYLTVQNTKIIVNTHGITYITLFRKQIKMTWSDIIKVKISPLANLVFISNDDRIKVSFHLIGFPILIIKTVEHISPDNYSKRVSKYINNIVSGK